ncbi:GNAT family N-acetyltransferase [soil metagenome]
MRTSHLTLRPFSPEEYPTAFRLLMRVFGEAVDDKDMDAERAVVEYDRTLATFDGEEMVGVMSAFSFDMSVPGGSLPVGGTTWVGVSPTHRRRGVLSTMMRRHLDDVAARGEPLAALWASEAAIYGRYGYGVAIEQLHCTVALDQGLTWEATTPPAATQVSLVPLEEAYAVLNPIYEACRRRRAGMHVRSEAWWGQQALSTRPNVLSGMSEKLVAVAEVDGRDAAYAIYGQKPGSVHGRPDGRMKVMEMAGVDTTAEAAMWRYLLDHDLVRTVEAWGRPADEPLPLLLTDSRRVSSQVRDTLYVRVVDLPAALRGRGYADSVGVTIEVSDDVLEANDGVWRLEVAPEGASVDSAEGSAPDLRMDVRALGSLYMGGIGLRRLIAAGRVEVRNPTVVSAVEAAFATDEAPWVPEVW